MLFGKIHHLRYFSFGNFKSIDATHPHTIAVHMQHDSLRFFSGFIEEELQHHHHKFLRGEIVVQQQNLIHRRFLGFRFGFRQYVSVGIV